MCVFGDVFAAQRVDHCQVPILLIAKYAAPSSGARQVSGLFLQAGARKPVASKASAATGRRKSLPAPVTTPQRESHEGVESQR